MEIDVVRESERFYYRFEEIPEAAGEITIYPEQNVTVLYDGVASELPVSMPKTGFWRRQFGSEVTVGQRKFDWMLGVILPLFCFLFDPVVFRGIVGRPILGKFQLPAYILGFVSIMGMTAWMLWGDRLKWLNGWLAGLFFVSSGISLIVGAILAPFSVIGILALIGFLGFTPLFSSIVYLRNGVRALRAASEAFERVTLVNVAVLSGMIGVAVPYLIGGWWR